MSNRQRTVRALPDVRLLRISKAKVDLIKAWKEGEDLSTKSSIEILVAMTAAHRWRLARTLLAHGRSFTRQRPPALRSAISRYYYSMYHALRASAYMFHGGDDHEEHRHLPGKIPTDFPNHGTWQNILKSARDHRNQADYDPYPRTSRVLEPIAIQLRHEAETLIALSKAYLSAKGCPL